MVAPELHLEGTVVEQPSAQLDRREGQRHATLPKRLAQGVGLRAERPGHAPEVDERLPQSALQVVEVVDPGDAAGLEVGEVRRQAGDLDLVQAPEDPAPRVPAIAEIEVLGPRDRGSRVAVDVEMERQLPRDKRRCSWSNSRTGNLSA